MVMALCNPYRVEVGGCSSTQGDAPRLRRCAYPGLCCLDPVGVGATLSLAPFTCLFLSSGAYGSWLHETLRHSDSTE